MAQPSAKGRQVQAQSSDIQGGSNNGHSHGHSFRASLDGTRDSLLHAGETVERKAKSILDGFSDFALRDNVLEVATGLM